MPKVKNDHQTDVFAGESLLRMEDHRRQTALLLQKFETISCDGGRILMGISDSKVDHALCSFWTELETIVLLTLDRTKLRRYVNRLVC